MHRPHPAIKRFFPHFCALLLLVGCSEPEGTTFDSLDGVDPSELSRNPGSERGVFWSEALLHDEILRFNPDYARDGVFQISGGRPVGISVANTNVTDLRFLKDLPVQALEITGTAVVDLTPVAGLPLRELWAERTNVQDLTPLQGLPLRKLYLSMTPVRDLSGLEGLPLEEVNLAGTQVSDLSPLADSPVQMLWLNGCPVSDLTPLEGMPLIDLTLSGTDVTDLGSLAKTRLLRLYMDGLEIEDLTPLLGLRLTRLVFSPRHVKKGLDELRQHESLREMGTTFSDLGNDMAPPAVFWAQLDGRLARPEPYDTSAFLDGAGATAGENEPTTGDSPETGEPAGEAPQADTPEEPAAAAVRPAPTPYLGVDEPGRLEPQLPLEEPAAAEEAEGDR